MSRICYNWREFNIIQKKNIKKVRSWKNTILAVRP